MAFFDYPGTPYTGLAFLDNQPAYTANEGVDSLLDIAREIEMSGNYYFMAIPFPNSGGVLIDARDSKSGVIVVPPLAYLVSLTGYSKIYDPEVTGETDKGMMVRIYDKGAKMETAINAQFIISTLNMGGFPNTVNDASGYANDLGGMQGQYWLKTPMVVLRPGSVQLEITNLSALSAHCQIMLNLAVPINQKSINEVLIEGSNQNT